MLSGSWASLVPSPALFPLRATGDVVPQSYGSFIEENGVVASIAQLPFASPAVSQDLFVILISESNYTLLVYLPEYLSFVCGYRKLKYCLGNKILCSLKTIYGSFLCKDV